MAHLGFRVVAPKHEGLAAGLSRLLTVYLTP